LAAWLRARSGLANVPGGNAIATAYNTFKAELPAICAAKSLDVEELTFADYTGIVVQYLTI
jgi:hypothetical protein